MTTRKVPCSKCNETTDHTMQPVINNVVYENVKLYVYIQACTICKKSTNVALPS